MSGERSAGDRYEDFIIGRDLPVGTVHFRAFLSTVPTSNIPAEFNEAVARYTFILANGGGGFTSEQMPYQIMQGLLGIQCETEDEVHYLLARTAAIAGVKGIGELTLGTEDYETKRNHIITAVGGMINMRKKLLRRGFVGTLVPPIGARRRLKAEQRVQSLDDQIEANVNKEEFVAFREELKHSIILVEDPQQ